jgi:hypothetical protein
MVINSDALNITFSSGMTDSLLIFLKKHLPVDVSGGIVTDGYARLRSRAVTSRKTHFLGGLS